MITDADINAVYRVDKKRPYYSLQGGARKKNLTRREFRRQWIWGHFTEALKHALEHPVCAE